jgi:molecular chaperone GrpE
MKAHETVEPKNAEQSAKDGGAADQAAAGALEVEPLSIEEQLVAKEKESRENWDRFLRERADLENFRKRANREKEELLNYGYKSLIEEILPVLDNLERALSHASEDGLPALVEGIRMTHGMLLASLRKFNVRPVEAVGAPFDPAFHQAVAQAPTDEYPPNTVVEEYQKGYLLKDRLLRPAMVSVSTETKDDSETCE